jgi:hypothetical protein
MEDTQELVVKQIRSDTNKQVSRARTIYNAKYFQYTDPKGDKYIKDNDKRMIKSISLFNEYTDNVDAITSKQPYRNLGRVEQSGESSNEPDPTFQEHGVGKIQKRKKLIFRITFITVVILAILAFFAFVTTIIIGVISMFIITYSAVDNYDLQFKDVKTPEEFEKFLHTHHRSFVTAPKYILPSGKIKKGGKCDFFNYNKPAILAKLAGLDSENSVELNRIYTKCRSVDYNPPPVYKSILVAKRRRWASRILGK